MTVTKVIYWSIFLLAKLCAALHDGRELAEDYSNEWVVHLDGSNSSFDPDFLAAELGYQNMGEIPGFENYYLMLKSDHPSSMREELAEHTRNLAEDVQVIFAQQLFHKYRVKRKSQYTEEDKRITSELMDLWHEASGEENPTASNYLYSDPQWNDEWYLHEKLTRDGSFDKSLHVIDAFKSGYNGTGVRVVVLDDGLDYKHEDIFQNYDPEISWDYNSGYKGDADPSPRAPSGEYDSQNSHGTRCAGEIAMIPNNQVCGVGVAYGAKIGAVRMLDGRIDDRVEGLSLQHAIDKVDIFTASWGPTDDGKTVEGPGHMALEAIKKGIKKGRKGKGTIYVWASGNGGIRGDNCNCDGYTSNMHTISIGSVTSRGIFPWYGEKCSSTMAVTFSSGDNDEPKIATTDVNNECTVGHTGTSASAPLAAGIFALVLQANPNLTWRDLQHLVAQTSSSEGLENNSGWYRNAAGIQYNHRFGFGLLNAKSLTETAKIMDNSLGKQEKCIVKSKDELSIKLGEQKQLVLQVNCPIIKYVEHALITLTLETQNRGQLEIAIKSPTGDYSQLLTKREEDTSNAGFKDWTFNTVHFWGTDPNGEFILLIDHNDWLHGKSFQNDTTAKLKNVHLTLYGTSEMPQLQKLSWSTEKSLQMENFEDFLADENERPSRTSSAMDEIWNSIFG